MVRWVCAVLVVMMVGGCGLKEFAEDTRDSVKKGNTIQEKILRNLDRTRDMTKGMRDSLKATKDAIHLQILTSALQQMFQPENTALLDPPLRMMPYARVFALEATPDELIEACHLMLQDALQAPAAQKPRRLTSLVALGALAGFASDASVSSLVKTQIEGQGRYEDAAYVFLLMRYDFIRDYLFKPILETTKHLNRGALNEAVTAFYRLRRISHLSYASELVLHIPSLEVDDRLDPKEAAKLGRRAKTIFEHALKRRKALTPGLGAILKGFDS